MYEQDLVLQMWDETQTIETEWTMAEHPIVALFPIEVEEKEYTWPKDWSWSDDMLTF